MLQLFEYPVDTMVQFKYKRDGDATYHPDFLDHNRKGENIRDPWNEVFEGTRVFHASRAYGPRVMAFDASRAYGHIVMALHASRAYGYIVMAFDASRVYGVRLYRYGLPCLPSHERTAAPRPSPTAIAATTCHGGLMVYTIASGLCHSL